MLHSTSATRPQLTRLYWKKMCWIKNTLALDKPQSELLPNLFNPQQNEGTSLSGKVHMDEDDNIIGAEVQVAIPTSL